MKRAVCKIEECEKPVNGRGWCAMHYRRWRLYDDPLVVTVVRHSGTPEERFWAKVDKEGPVSSHRPDLGPCWVWTGSTQLRGYGSFRVGAHTVLAHRFAYETEFGSVVPGFELDHLCRMTSCVRPTHLEPVTHLENMFRGAATGCELWNGVTRNMLKTHCPAGHEYTEANTYWQGSSRSCQECRNIRSKMRAVRR